MEAEVNISISSEADVVTARQSGRELASKLGFSSSDLTIIATAISELARNIIQYAKQGQITIRLGQKDESRGIIIVAKDQGPGIADIDLAMQDGYSSRNGLGLGLPGVKRLMDDFEISSEAGKGTTVKVEKWKKELAMA